MLRVTISVNNPLLTHTMFVVCSIRGFDDLEALNSIVGQTKQQSVFPPFSDLSFWKDLQNFEDWFGANKHFDDFSFVHQCPNLTHLYVDSGYISSFESLNGHPK